jgi:hypothetical protein
MAGKDEIGYDEKPPTLLARGPFDSTSDLAIDSNDDHSSKIYLHRLAPPGLRRRKRTDANHSILPRAAAGKGDARFRGAARVAERGALFP